LDDLLLDIKKLDLSTWLQGTSFVVRSKIIDNEKLDTMELEREIGAVIFEKYKSKVDLENPDITFFVYVAGNDFYFGVDYAGFDISKRGYRIFCQSDSIKGTVAYSLVRLSNYKNGDILLDPFCQSGTVAIEAAFFAAKKPVNYYNKDKFAFLKFPVLKDFDFEKFFLKMDKSVDVKGITASDNQQRSVKAAEKNAKVAGLNKQINFSRLDIEWLDTKFEKGSVDIIVSNPPKISRLLTEKGFEKVFQEFFYTAEFILSSKGRIVILAKNYKQILGQAQRYNFTLKSNFPIHQGKEEFNILIFEKAKK
jgi:tRNA (guanine6-N2)-methyltransferase